jgi:DNA gyrase subunit A
MVQRTSVRGINRYGRAAQGVRVMNLREDDVVSAVALVVETDAATAAAAAGIEEPDGAAMTGVEGPATVTTGNGAAPGAVEPPADGSLEDAGEEPEDFGGAPEDDDDDDGDVDGVIAVDPDDE